jgi:hypothetical protein
VSKFDPSGNWTLKAMEPNFRKGIRNESSEEESSSLEETSEAEESYVR